MEAREKREAVVGGTPDSSQKPLDPQVAAPDEEKNLGTWGEQTDDLLHVAIGAPRVKEKERHCKLD